MKRRPVVAGRRTSSHSNRKAAESRSTSASGRNITTGIVIPLAALVTAFFTTPAYDAWQDFTVSLDPALKAEVSPQKYPHGYVFPARLPAGKMEELGRAEQPNYRGFADSGGIPVEPSSSGGGNEYRLDLTGNRREPVRILDIRAHVVERKPIPRDGTMVSWIKEGGGLVEGVTANLKSDEARVLDPSLGRPFFDGKFRYLKKGEPISFEVGATARECWCSWEIEVDVSYDDKKETMRVRSDGTENGPPLQTVGWAAHEEGESRGFRSEYGLAYPDANLLNCADAKTGSPKAVEFAKRNDACGFDRY